MLVVQAPFTPPPEPEPPKDTDIVVKHEWKYSIYPARRSNLIPSHMFIEILNKYLIPRYSTMSGALL
jgi:hypothetical protein